MNYNGRVRDEVRVPRRTREKYTKLEERKMWYFFARELRAGNEDAIKRRKILWKVYEQEEETTKKWMGLESHFRKQMVKEIHMSTMSKEDMFLCLRFFKIGLNTAQHRYLEGRYGCEIECTFDGTFRRANFSFGDSQFTLPTEGELTTIFGDNMMDEDLLDEINAAEMGMDAFNDGDIIPSTSTNQPNRSTMNRISTRVNLSRISDEIIYVPPEEQQQQNNSDVGGGNGIILVAPEQPQDEQQNGQVSRHEPEEVRRRESPPPTPSRINVGSELNSTAAAERQNEENFQIEHEARTSRSPMSSTGRGSQRRNNNSLANVKQAFLDGALKVFDGTLSPRAFLDPFLYLEGGIYAKYAHGIDWLAGEEDDDEPAY